MENDDEFLRSIKSRLVNLHSEDSLKVRLCKFVARNINMYISRASRMGLGQLPSILRTQILTELTKVALLHSDSTFPANKRSQNIMNYSQVIKEAFKLLLSSETQSVDLTWLSFPPAQSRVQSIEEVLHLVSSLAPNVRALTLQNESAPDHESASSDILHASCIGRLNHLHTLELQHFSIKYQELLDLGTRLPSLQILNIKIYFVEHFEVDMEALRRSLPNLKQFLFRRVVVKNDQLHDYSRIFALLCIQHLPGLEAVGSLISSPESFSLEAEELVELTWPPCSLRHLLVRDSAHADKVDWHNLFPEVTHLELTLEEAADRCADPYSKFPGLVGLRLVGPTINVLPCLSYRYKTNLHTLEVDGYGQVSFSFKKIFTYFPNLRELALTRVQFVPDLEPLDPQLLHSLIKLHLSSTPNVYPVVIQHIMSAPNLEKVELKYLKLDAEEVQHLTWMISSHQIFRELKCFLLHFTLEVRNNYSNLTDYCQLVKNICVNSAKLVELALYVKSDDHKYLDFTQEQIFEDLGESKMMHFLAAFKNYC